MGGLREGWRRFFFREVSGAQKLLRSGLQEVGRLLGDGKGQLTGHFTRAY